MLQNNEEVIDILRKVRTLSAMNFYERVLCDRFGFWNTPQVRKLPHESSNTLETEALKRATSIGKANIMWSGGIDSTFIICSYIKAKVPFTVFCDQRSIRDGNEFFSWMIKNGVSIKFFKDIRDSYSQDKMVHGYTADILFSWGDPDKYYAFSKDDSWFFNNLTDYQKTRIYLYGKYIGKPTDTFMQVSRLMTYGCFYLRSIFEMHTIVFPQTPMIPFFDTEEFNNISYTSYWDKTFKDGKPEMKKFIGDVTQSEDVYNGIHRSGTKIGPRLKLDDFTYDTYSSKLQDPILDNYSYIGYNI